jgi:hypothetical protein
VGTRSRLVLALSTVVASLFGTNLVHASAATPPDCGQPTATTVSCSFSYNGTNGSDGSAQTFVVPAGITRVTIEAWGAQGRDGFGFGSGGTGGHARGTFVVTPGSTLSVRVGGRPASIYRGFNGGGMGGYGGAGGGASDVRIGGDGLAARAIVAGGGGGSGSHIVSNAGVIVSVTSFNGGGGGGPTGGDAQCGFTSRAAECGTGATQESGGAAGTSRSLVFCGNPSTAIAAEPGTVGRGGNGGGSRGPSYSCTGGGGGGGYYGGGGGALTIENDLTGFYGAGGGGSGFVSPNATATINETTYDHTGNGLVTITYPRTPSSIASCKNGGWRNLVDGTGKAFANEGLCVAWAARHTR